MSGIAIAALMTFALSLLVYGAVLWRLAKPDERWLLFGALVLVLPMSSLAFYVLRQPLDMALSRYLSASPAFPWLRLLYAPLTEEPAKLWPLLIVPLARRVNRDNAVRVAMALGLGFGLGEIALVAQLLSRNAQIVALPWYALGGFINERFMVCLTHGLFTSMAVCAWQRRIQWRWLQRLWSGLLLGMLLHLLANAPILIVGSGILGSAQFIGQIVLSLWVPLLWVLSMFILLRLNQPKAASLGVALFGYADCPKCGAHYARPFFALNLGIKRLERCPKCHRWSVL